MVLRKTDSVGSSQKLKATDSSLDDIFHQSERAHSRARTQLTKLGCEQVLEMNTTVKSMCASWVQSSFPQV
jgi:hypothetical protein